MNSIVKQLLRYSIGIPCKLIGQYGLIFRKRTLIKYEWLAHYLIGNGSDKWIPQWLIESEPFLTDESFVEYENGCIFGPDDRDDDASFFHCVGYFQIQYRDGILDSIDRYDFHPVSYSSEDFYNLSVELPYRLGEFLYPFLKKLFLMKNIWRVCDIQKITHPYKVRDVYVLYISDKVFYEIGGTEFNTHIYYNYTGE